MSIWARIKGFFGPPFRPDWVSRPGETIKTRLERIDMGTYEFSQATRLNLFEVVSLFNGSLRITPALAERIARVVGSTPRFWLERDFQYVLGCRRLGYLPGPNHP